MRRLAIQGLGRRIAALGACAVLLGAAGCVSTKVQPESEAVFFMTRAGDTVTLSWISEANRAYTILYTNNRSGGQWQPAQGGANIKGNGDQITFVEKVAPDEQRYYRVQIGPKLK